MNLDCDVAALPYANIQLVLPPMLEAFAHPDIVPAAEPNGNPLVVVGA
jgi:hypothetical protein